VKTELQTTSDGSHTLYVPEIDETYHSTHGAIQESSHIFIKEGLQQCRKQSLNILEIGFGTGLNAFLTAIEAEKSGQEIHYYTLEKFPVPLEKTLQLNYSHQISSNNANALFEKIHKAEWEIDVKIANNFVLKKLHCDFTTYQPDATFEVIYFDAFSPEKQPEMWTEEQFQKIYTACNQGAILTTYCAKGAVRRALQAVGFKVERLPGPPGKREILRGIR
jgi:tRNA U34 5-methylaminomethyl-2-thiouridine-forming methyltransferase MnmC